MQCRPAHAVIAVVVIETRCSPWIRLLSFCLLARGSVSNAKAKDRQAWTWNEQNERGSEMTSGLGDHASSDPRLRTRSTEYPAWGVEWRGSRHSGRARAFLASCGEQKMSTWRRLTREGTNQQPLSPQSVDDREGLVTQSGTDGHKTSLGRRCTFTLPRVQGRMDIAVRSETDAT